MSILNNNERNGNFTSSEIVNLTKTGKGENGFGAAAITYIKEKNQERRLGRSLSLQSEAKPLVWGLTLEGRVFNMLPEGYTYSSQETNCHPNIPYWCGSKDGMNGTDCVIDIKCPMTLSSFCDLVQPLYDGLEGIECINAVRDNHKDGDKYYWQLVSNAIINNCTHAELVIYMPYESEIPEIRVSYPNVRFMQNDDLPFIKDGGYYNNLNIIRFEVPQSDIDLLTERVSLAGSMLLGSITSKDELTKRKLNKKK